MFCLNEIAMETKYLTNISGKINKQKVSLRLCSKINVVFTRTLVNNTALGV